MGEPDLEFIEPAARALGEAFLRDGRCIQRAERPELLERLRNSVVRLAAGHLGLPEVEALEDPAAFLNAIHGRVPIASLNELRLGVIRGLNRHEWLRPLLYQLAKTELDALVGNELAMQRRVNLSIQMPGDDSSLLALHSDVWSGDSPYEVVLWVPLVDCFRTKSMYLIPPAKDARLRELFAAGRGESAEQLFGRVREQAEFLKVSYGELMLFSQALGHGNRVNQEPETRWSLNVRFKGLYTPYGDKGLGNFFEPISLRPLSRVGLDYLPPSIH